MFAQLVKVTPQPFDQLIPHLFDSSGDYSAHIFNPKTRDKYFRSRNLSHVYLPHQHLFKDKLTLTHFLYRNFPQVFPNAKTDNKCLQCGQPTRFFNFIRGYFHFCSNHCGTLHESTKFKQSQTNLTRYGVAHVWESPTIRAKSQATIIERYEVTRPTSNPGIKHRATFLRNNNGIKSTFELPVVHAKSQATNLARYGTRHYAERNLKNYEHLTPEWILSLNNNSTYISYELRCWLAEYFGYSVSSLHSRLIDRLESMGFIVDKNTQVSKAELHLRDEVLSLLPKGVTPIFNDRNTIKGIHGHFLELDIYIPELSLAFEFDGIYWHSNSPVYADDLSKEDYKTEVCRKLGINLYHINKFTDYKSFLSKILNNLSTN